MSIYSTDFVKPITQIFSQQPKHNFEINEILNLNTLDSVTEGTKTSKSNKKPVAYVSPIETLKSKDQAIQTDSISIDINSIIDINDFKRSERIVGKLDLIDSNCEYEDLTSAMQRIKYLESSLKQQLKINEDIKKLLIASLGEDLAAHFVKLTSDIACFNERVEELITQKIECNENIDTLSIEANMWKNKFFAGRILVDELAGWKEQFSRRYNESLDAIHGLLQERQILRRLLDLLRNELIVTAAHLNFKPKTNSSTDTLDLTKTNINLLQTIKTLLCNGTVWNNQITFNEDSLSDFKDFTKGEELALEVLKNQPNLYADNTARITTSFVSENSHFLEKIADKLCKNCKGDIFVI